MTSAHELRPLDTVTSLQLLFSLMTLGHELKALDVMNR